MEYELQITRGTVVIGRQTFTATDENGGEVFDLIKQTKDELTKLFKSSDYRIQVYSVERSRIVGMETWKCG